MKGILGIALGPNPKRSADERISGNSVRAGRRTGVDSTTLSEDLSAKSPQFYVVDDTRKKPRRRIACLCRRVKLTWARGLGRHPGGSRRRPGRLAVELTRPWLRCSFGRGVRSGRGDPGAGLTLRKLGLTKGRTNQPNVIAEAGACKAERYQSQEQIVHRCCRLARDQNQEATPKPPRPMRAQNMNAAKMSLIAILLLFDSERVWRARIPGRCVLTSRAPRGSSSRLCRGMFAASGSRDSISLAV